MIRLHASVLAAVMTLSWPSFSVAQSTLNGPWELAIQSPQGPMSVDVTLKQEGENVTGEVNSPLGTVNVTGKMQGDTLHMAYSLPVGGNPLEITMTGKLTGDTMAGSVTIAGLGEIPWTAKRKVVPAGAPEPPAASSPLAAPVPVDANAPATGKWNLTIALGGAGSLAMTANLTQTGEKVSGNLVTQMGEVPVTGTMVGTTLKLDFKAPTPQGEMPVTMTGELGADGFSGKTSIAGLGDTSWTAKRALE
jgi:hypothetical protein